MPLVTIPFVYGKKSQNFNSEKKIIQSDKEFRLYYIYIPTTVASSCFNTLILIVTVQMKLYTDKALPKHSQKVSVVSL